MVELQDNQLIFRFPKVHPDAVLTIEFQRTLRIPDDDQEWPLPPGLDRFPVQHVDDWADRVPPSWVKQGGVMVPMYQSEALWIDFSSRYISEHRTEYPFAVMIAAGKINAVTGKRWKGHLTDQPQNYLSIPKQPWLDGFCVKKGVIRQFVAMPLGEGYTAEEQLTGDAIYGGLQIQVFPMKRSAFRRHFPKQRARLYSNERHYQSDTFYLAEYEMGLAPGGKMRQEIYEDPFDIDDWKTKTTSRCFVHLCNSLSWREITGKQPPKTPATEKEYRRLGLPWFEWYSDAPALKGSKKLKKLKSIGKKKHNKKRSNHQDPKNDLPDNVIPLGKQKNQNGTSEDGLVPLLTSNVAGFQFYDGEKIWDQLRPNDTLRLEREPTNEYDSRAIEIYWKHFKLGYLPREDNVVAWQWIDHGVKLHARLAKCRMTSDPSKRIELEILFNPETLLPPG